MGFSGTCDKYDKRYFSYIRTNKNYWFRVDLTKSSPFKKIRTLPHAGLIPSVVVYICLAATTFEIISSEKIRTKRKKTTKKRNSIDVLSNLKIKTNVELVRTYVLAKYLEYDRRKAPLPDRSKRYIKDLENDIKQNDLKNPVVLAISKKTERAYIYEGNHRMAALLDNNIDWVPLMVNYFFLNDDDDTHFCFVPRTVNGNWPSNPNPSNFGFETKSI